MQPPDGEPRPPRADEPLAVEGVVFDLDGTPTCRARCARTKPRVTTLVLLDALGIGALFDAVVAAGDASRHKPHPAPLRCAGELLRVPCERLVLVGDGLDQRELPISCS